jgi:heterodisulfide reductase subunit B
MIEIVGAEPASGYEQKVTCCGGALAFSEPEKSQKQIRDIVESAYDHGAEMIVTPCQLCQANVEVYQSEINKKKGTKLAMPVVYYSQLKSVAYGGSLKEAGLDGHVIQPERLQKIAERKNNHYHSRPIWCEGNCALSVHPPLDWQLHPGLSSHPA